MGNCIRLYSGNAKLMDATLFIVQDKQMRTQMAYERDDGRL